MDDGRDQRIQELLTRITKAKEERVEAAAEDTAQVVVFSRADQVLALEGDHVREIAPLGDLTPVPGAPPFVLGLMNLRGEIEAVIDTVVLLETPVGEAVPEDAKVILVEALEIRTGILAEAVLDVAEIPAREIAPPLHALDRIKREYVKGELHRGDRTAVLLNLPGIFQQIFLEDTGLSVEAEGAGG